MINHIFLTIKVMVHLILGTIVTVLVFPVVLAIVVYGGLFMGLILVVVFTPMSFLDSRDATDFEAKFRDNSKALLGWIGIVVKLYVVVVLGSYGLSGVKGEGAFARWVRGVLSE